MSEPINALTGHPYGGKNTEALLATGSETMVFATLHQWNELGRKIIKGSKPTMIRLGCNGGTASEEGADESAPEPKQTGRKKGFFSRRMVAVFSYEQTEESEWAREKAAQRKAKRERKGQAK